MEINTCNKYNINDIILEKPVKFEDLYISNLNFTIQTPKLEILKVSNFIKSQGKPDYQHYITQGEDEGSDDFSTEEELDPLYNKALSLIKKERRVSTSFLQRHFAIGYNRAARIVDTFEKKGIVSSANSMGRREVLINE